MSSIALPPSAIPADIPKDVRLQVVSTCPGIPDGDGWLHEIKHDGHRLVAIVTPDLTLLSRNGYDRTALFREPFKPLTGLPPMVLDGEIAVPDDRGVTHIDGLSETISERRPDRLAYFAFDLLHYDGHYLRRRPNRGRKLPMKYWFRFRQTSPSPPGQWIICGPYDSYDEAAKARSKSKAWDCEVGIPFLAESKEEAQNSASNT